MAISDCMLTPQVMKATVGGTEVAVKKFRAAFLSSAVIQNEIEFLRFVYHFLAPNVSANFAIQEL